MRYIYPARLPDIRDFAEPDHDGDTLWLNLDRGRRLHDDTDIRLSGVYAPELSQPGGQATKQFVVDWLAEAMTTNWMRPWPFAVETFKTKTGNDKISLERYVGVVYIGSVEDVWNKLPIPCLNNDINDFLALHPEWGGGTGP